MSTETGKAVFDERDAVTLADELHRTVAWIRRCEAQGARTGDATVCGQTSERLHSYVASLLRFCLAQGWPAQLLSPHRMWLGKLAEAVDARDPERMAATLEDSSCWPC